MYLLISYFDYSNYCPPLQLPPLWNSFAECQLITFRYQKLSTTSLHKSPASKFGQFLEHLDYTKIIGSDSFLMNVVSLRQFARPINVTSCG